jgi:GcrA cell cycle regulator
MAAPGQNIGNLNGLRWSLEHDAALKRLRKAGYSSSQIALELWTEFRTTYSRNAVIGRLHRLGLTDSRANPHRPGIVKQRAMSNSGPSMPRIRKPAVRPILTRETAALRCAEIEPRHVALVDLEPGDCRYPYGEGDYTFCGHPKLSDCSYCERHYALVQGDGTRSERQATA